MDLYHLEVSFATFVICALHTPSCAQKCLTRFIDDFSLVLFLTFLFKSPIIITHGIHFLVDMNFLTGTWNKNSAARYVGGG